MNERYEPSAIPNVNWLIQTKTARDHFSFCGGQIWIHHDGGTARC